MKYFTIINLWINKVYFEFLAVEYIFFFYSEVIFNQKFDSNSHPGIFLSYTSNTNWSQGF